MLSRGNWFWLAVLIAAAAVLQTGLAWRIRIGGAKPDFFLALMIVLSLRGRREDVFAANWLIGLAKDLTSGCGVVGMYAVLFLLAGAIVGTLGRHVFSEHGLIVLASAFGAALACEAAASVLVSLRFEQVALASLMKASLGGAVYTAAITPLLAWAMIRPARWMHLPLARTGRQ